MAVHDFHTQRRIEFADTDSAGIVHFSRFFVFMETAEHEFLRSLGYSVHASTNGRTIGWPRLEATCQYTSPARFEDVLDIHVEVLEIRNRALAYGFEMAVGDRRIATGRLAAVCCVVGDDGKLEAVPIPPELANQLAVAPTAAKPLA